MQNTNTLENNFEVYSSQNNQTPPLHKHNLQLQQHKNHHHHHQQQQQQPQQMQIQQPHNWNQFQYHNQIPNTSQQQQQQSPQQQSQHSQQSKQNQNHQGNTQRQQQSQHQQPQQIQKVQQVIQQSGSLNMNNNNNNNNKQQQQFQQQQSQQQLQQSGNGGIISHNQSGYSINNQHFNQANSASIRKDNQQTHFKGQNQKQYNFNNNYQNQYPSGGQGMNNLNQRFIKNNNKPHINNISNNPNISEQAIMHTDSNNKGNQQVYKEQSKKMKGFQQQNQPRMNNSGLIQGNMTFFQDNTNSFSASNSQTFSSVNNIGNAPPNSGHLNSQNITQNQQQQGAWNSQQGNYFPLNPQQQIGQSSNLQAQQQNSSLEQFYGINSSQIQQQQLQQPQGYRKKRSDSFQFNSSTANNIQMNSSNQSLKKNKKQKQKQQQQQQFDINKQQLQQNQQQYQLQTQQFVQTTPLFNANQNVGMYPKQQKLKGIKDKTKRIVKQPKGTRERQYSKQFIIEQYKKYKKLKQKMNKSQATPKITTQALMNNQMNDFKEMSKSIQQIEENRQKKLSDSNLEECFAPENNKGEDNFNTNSDLAPNPSLDINDDIFPSNTTNNVSMLDTILENDEKKKEFFNRKVAKLLDLNGCSDNDSLKKLVQKLFQKLNKKSEKIRQLKATLKEKNNKLKNMKQQVNGHTGEEEDQFEYEEFDDHDDDEDFYDQNMEQEQTLSEYCYDSDEYIQEGDFEGEDDQLNEEQDENEGMEDEEIEENKNVDSVNQKNDNNKNTNINSNNNNNESNQKQCQIQFDQQNQQISQMPNRPRVSSSEQDQEKKKYQKKNLNKQFFPLTRLIKQCSIKDKQTEGETNLEQITFQNLRTTSEPVLFGQEHNFYSNTSLDKKIENSNKKLSNSVQNKQQTVAEDQNSDDNDHLRKKSNSF